MSFCSEENVFKLHIRLKVYKKVIKILLRYKLKINVYEISKLKKCC